MRRADIFQRWARSTAALLGCIVCGACASLTHRGRHQYVLVTSDPPGATIQFHGHSVGKTPQYVELPRQYRAQLQLLSKVGAVDVPLTTRYRWGDSFWPNLIFFEFAPLGWSVDGMTGAAWSYRDPATVKLKGIATQPVAPPPLVAIAPPEAESLVFSDEAGLLWNEKLLQLYPDTRVLAFSETLPQFTSRHYDFDRRPDSENEHELFGRLGIQKVFESSVAYQGEHILLTGHLRDVLTGEISETQTLTATPSQALEGEAWFERNHNWIHLLPNTVSLDWASSDTQLKSESGQTFQAQPVTEPTVVGQALPFLSSISLTRLQPPRRDAGASFRFQFVSAIRLAYSRIAFPTLAVVNNVQFDYTRAGVGIGPEVGWQWGAHYVYFNVIPIYGFHELRWSLPAADSGEISEWAFTMRTEAGYLYFLTQNLSLRLFSKSTSTPSDMWNSAIQEIQPTATSMGTSTDVSAGVSIGYTFEPRPDLRHWLVYSSEK